MPPRFETFTERDAAGVLWAAPKMTGDQGLLNSYWAQASGGQRLNIYMTVWGMGVAGESQHRSRSRRGRRRFLEC